MEQVFSVATPNGKSYNVARASAVDQKSLLMLVGARLTMVSASPSTPKDAIGATESLMGMLMSMGEADFDKVASLVLKRVFIPNSEQRITVNDFQGDMMSYMVLVAESVRENLQDFFTWLQVQKSEVPEPPKGPGIRRVKDGV